MSHNVEVRRLPKKTVVIIAIMSIATIIGFGFIMMTKNLKMEEVLSSLGHEKISSIKVVNRMSVEDKETKVKSTVYKVTFFDETLNKECIGFVHRSNDGKYSKDIDCK
ncbi:hypothetical protein [Halarcobacter sp.]|uniref:hypothetical protein n=1 Tax=Halarcobacter sp. TaxID=2321133 RepID=UPI003A9379EF